MASELHCYPKTPSLLHWPDTSSNGELDRRTGLLLVRTMIGRRNYHWIGHALMRGDNCTPSSGIYSLKMAKEWIARRALGSEGIRIQLNSQQSAEPPNQV